MYGHRPLYGIVDVVAAEGLSEKKKMDVKSVLQKFEEIFTEVPGRTELLECKLELTTSDLIQTPQYPIPFATRETIEE